MYRVREYRLACGPACGGLDCFRFAITGNSAAEVCREPAGDLSSRATVGFQGGYAPRIMSVPDGSCGRGGGGEEREERMREREGALRPPAINQSSSFLCGNSRHSGSR
jgi:hypothetical protein